MAEYDSTSARRSTSKEVVPALMKQFAFTNQLEVPRLMKVSLNMGLGEAVQNAEDHRGRRRGDGRRSSARSRS